MGAIFTGSGLASDTSGDVIIGPINVDSGLCHVALVAKSGSGTVTTPTNPKLQYSVDGTNFVDVSSGAVTVSSTSNAMAEVTKTNIVCKQIRVVAAGAFAAGDATITLYGREV